MQEALCGPHVPRYFSAVTSGSCKSCSASSLTQVLKCHLYRTSLQGVQDSGLAEESCVGYGKDIEDCLVELVLHMSAPDRHARDYRLKLYTSMLQSHRQNAAEGVKLVKMTPLRSSMATFFCMETTAILSTVGLKGGVLSYSAVSYLLLSSCSDNLLTALARQIGSADTVRDRTLLPNRLGRARSAFCLCNLLELKCRCSVSTLLDQSGHA